MKKLLIIALVTFCVSILFAELIWEDNFETDTGWVLTGEFEIDTPQGLGGEHGNADPAAAFEGTKILGVDLTGLGSQAGDYEGNVGDHGYTAVSPSINCGNYENVNLTFKSWLGLEQNQYDKGYIEVSNDGGNAWQIVWENSETIEENSWSDFTLDISEFANFQPDVKIRFAIGSTDGSWFYCGWNIDLLQLTGNPGEITEVTGNVIAEESSNAIEGAMVVLGFNTVYTDAEGNFVIQSAVGDFQLSVIAAGYYHDNQLITVSSETAPINVSLQTLLIPENLTGESPVENFVNLSWDAPSGSPEEIVGYNVYKNGAIFQTVTETSYTEEIEVAGTYDYTVSAIYLSGVSEQTEAVSIEVDVTDAEDVELALANHKLVNYPNPFNPTTTISFTAKYAQDAKIEIYNLKGQKIKSFVCHPELACPERSRREGQAQTFSITWNGTDSNNKAVSSGIYYSVLKQGGKTVATNKMVLLK